ncbi:hypothetical protein PR202_ga07379 [Eleusine coracana subsp. coracana]|uniref:Protein kinase domain-containing protein n=1 Tax=Eleusine coracana subsp. coracana TaxID=191504 RepID=A0AAV5C0M0_ELECO|nr:hypothetical protein PR202_ga07379 [Eleusine coracana subsp. coracana]
MLHISSSDCPSFQHYHHHHQQQQQRPLQQEQGGTRRSGSFDRLPFLLENGGGDHRGVAARAGHRPRRVGDGVDRRRPAHGRGVRGEVGGGGARGRPSARARRARRRGPVAARGVLPGLRRLGRRRVLRSVPGDAPGGSLADEARRRRCDCEEEEGWVRARSADVLRGLAHVHAAGWAHCDVKGRNVLLGADGRAMLADFGCARWTTGDEGNAGGGAGIRGTPAFMAPEAARGEAQGLAADVWALGCTVIEMAAGGAAPWTGRFADPVAALHHVAHSGEVPEPPAWLSDEGKDFLARCLVRDPAGRWTAAQLLHHPFVAAAAASSSSSAAIDPSVAAAAKGGHRVSPKSILDQAFWEESESELGSDSSATDESETTTAAAAALTPADRVGALAGGVAPDWTWISGDEEWITVFAADIAAPHPQLDAPTPPKFDADTAESFGADARGISTAGASEEPHIVGGGEHMGADAWPSRGGRGHGGGASSSAGSRRGDHGGGSNNECGCSSSGNSASASDNKVVQQPDIRLLTDKSEAR